MTDLEKIKRCAEKMGLVVIEQLGELRIPNTQFEESLYDPLEDNAQAFALDTVILREGWLIKYDHMECYFHHYDKPPIPLVPQIMVPGRPEPLTVRRIPKFEIDMTDPANRRRVRVDFVSGL